MMYFTQWSAISTTICLIAGSFVTNDDAEMVQDLNYIDDDFLKKKYSPFRAWKIYCLFFELSLVMEVIVTIFFWGFLFPYVNFNDPTFTFAFKLQLVTDHMMPIILLLADFTINTVPFCWRHFLFMLVYITSYGIVNIICTKERGKPVYPPLDWFRKPKLAIMITIALFVASFLLFVFFKYL